LAAPKHDAALAAAIADIGKHEVPLGSNTGPFVIQCQRASWLGGTNWPWCRAAVLKWRKQAGDKPGDLSPGAWDALARARKRGEVLEPSEWGRAIAGDEVIWNIGSGHSSLLEKITLDGSNVTVHTIDGNASDQVKRCQRPLSQVKGFIAWPETPLDKADRRPLIHKIGSESGKRKVAVAGVKIPLPRTADKVT
jgi:hypothetical protein